MGTDHQGQSWQRRRSKRCGVWRCIMGKNTGCGENRAEPRALGWVGLDSERSSMEEKLEATTSWQPTESELFWSKDVMVGSESSERSDSLRNKHDPSVQQWTRHYSWIQSMLWGMGACLKKQSKCEPHLFRDTLGQVEQVPYGNRPSLLTDLPGNTTWKGTCEGGFITLNHADRYAHICNTLLSRQLAKPPNPSFTSFVCHLALSLWAPAFSSLWLDNFNIDEKLFISDMGEPVSSVDWITVCLRRGLPPGRPKVVHKG